MQTGVFFGFRPHKSAWVGKTLKTRQKLCIFNRVNLFPASNSPRCYARYRKKPNHASVTQIAKNDKVENLNILLYTTVIYTNGDKVI